MLKAKAPRIQRFRFGISERSPLTRTYPPRDKLPSVPYDCFYQMCGQSLSWRSAIDAASTDNWELSQVLLRVTTRLSH